MGINICSSIPQTELIILYLWEYIIIKVPSMVLRVPIHLLLENGTMLSVSMINQIQLLKCMLMEYWKIQ